MTLCFHDYVIFLTMAAGAYYLQGESAAPRREWHSGCEFSVYAAESLQADSEENFSYREVSSDALCNWPNFVGVVAAIRDTCSYTIRTILSFFKW